MQARSDSVKKWRVQRVVVFFYYKILRMYDIGCDF
jgi:hypothetical protein